MCIFLYIGCVLHYRDLKSAQEIVREVAYSGSSDGNAPYADMKAVLCFIADVVCIPDFRVNMAKSAVNVFYIITPQRLSHSNPFAWIIFIFI